MRAYLLCALLLLGGCRGTRVSVMGWEPGRPIRAASSELSTDEKVGVVVVLGAVVALGVAGALAVR